VSYRQCVGWNTAQTNGSCRVGIARYKLQDARPEQHATRTCADHTSEGNSAPDHSEYELSTQMSLLNIFTASLRWWRGRKGPHGRSCPAPIIRSPTRFWSSDSNGKCKLVENANKIILGLNIGGWLKSHLLPTNRELSGKLSKLQVDGDGRQVCEFVGAFVKLKRCLW
jgi:hypothetical protein